MNCTHLSRVERYQIYALKKAGHNLTEIAHVLERHPSRICLELSRNLGKRGYRPKQEQSLVDELRAVNTWTIDDAT